MLIRRIRSWKSRWGSVSLTTRILAVNIFALALFTGGFFYLDSYRNRLVDARQVQVGRELVLLNETLAHTPRARQAELILAFTQVTGTRVRIFAPDGPKQLDSFALAPPTFRLRDPARDTWERMAARAIDRVVDSVAGGREPEVYADPVPDTGQAWPEGRAARSRPGVAAPMFRFAPDRTPMISAALVSPVDGRLMLATTNATDITRTVRDERLRFAFVLLAAVLSSILLSLFLARTIIRPLRRLSRAAVKVRLGRARDVAVPRLPARRDEIGSLARALSDMSSALRDRIDAGERFAADVTHELKNPIASLRSALEGLGGPVNPEQRAQLLAIANDDCRRLDRLVSDISEASRMDAQLSRARFEPVDLGAMIGAMLKGREARSTAAPAQARLSFAHPPAGSAMVLGDASRLERVFDNIIDNARSFSPPDGSIRIAARQEEDQIVVTVEDDGPGVAPEEREAIFHRFHTVRPSDEPFGQHSGLGLPIARAIILGHQGTMRVCDRSDGRRGACFEVRLPAHRTG